VGRKGKSDPPKLTVKSHLVPVPNRARAANLFAKLLRHVSEQTEENRRKREAINNGRTSQ
jgi:hypothetical protein